jgi:hypothetical protein
MRPSLRHEAVSHLSVTLSLISRPLLKISRDNATGIGAEERHCQVRAVRIGEGAMLFALDEPVGFLRLACAPALYPWL